MAIASASATLPEARYRSAASSDASIAAGYVEKAQHGEGMVGYLLHLIPDTFIGAFADGNLLQVLVIAILTGFACVRLGDFGERVAHVLDETSKLFFGIIHIVVRLAPIGAFGAMGFTIGKYWVAVLAQLGAWWRPSMSPRCCSYWWCWEGSPGPSASRSSGSWPISARSC